MPSPRSFRLFRTTAFKLSAIFLAVFTIFAVFLIGTIAGNMNAILETQTGRRRSTPSSAPSRCSTRPAACRGWRASSSVRSRQPGASLYFVTDRSGEKIAGNVEAVPAAILDQTGEAAQVVPYTSRDEKGSQAAHRAGPRGGASRRRAGAGRPRRQRARGRWCASCSAR